MEILAVVTTNDKFIRGIPVFLAESVEEKEAVADDLRRILRAEVATLSNGTLLLLPVRNLDAGNQ